MQLEMCSKKDELVQQLAASLKEPGAILRGKKKASRTTALRWPDAKDVRLLKRFF